MVKKKLFPQKQQIISEYLTGTQTLVELEKKYGVNARTIQTWVRLFRKKQPSASKSGLKEADEKALKKQLADSLLKNELLEEMLRLSEEQTGIDFRKKFGTRQS